VTIPDGRIENAAWDRLTPAQVREAVRSLRDGPRRSEPKEQFVAKGLVHAFQTREGGIGVLTVIDNPKGKGVEVLYRLAGRSATEWSDPFGSAGGALGAKPTPRSETAK